MESLNADVSLPRYYLNDEPINHPFKHFQTRVIDTDHGIATYRIPVRMIKNLTRLVGEDYKILVQLFRFRDGRFMDACGGAYRVLTVVSKSCDFTGWYETYNLLIAKEVAAHNKLHAPREDPLKSIKEIISMQNKHIAALQDQIFVLAEMMGDK